MKTALVVLVWALLLFRVITMIQDERQDALFLATLALFAWLGGLITYEVTRLIFTKMRGTNA